MNEQHRQPLILSRQNRRIELKKSGESMNRLVFVGLLAAAVVVVSIVWLIRTKRLQERHAILWLVAATVSAILGIWQDGLGMFSRLIGVAYPPSALLIVVFVLLGLILLDTVIELSRTVRRTRTLAQRVALLEERLERMENGEGAGDDASHTA